MCVCVCVCVRACVRVCVCVCVCVYTSDFGFNQSTFSGSEQGENFRIPIMFFSGGVEQGVFINVNLNLSGTAGKSRFQLDIIGANHCIFRV